MDQAQIPIAEIVTALAALAGLGLVAAATLKGWQGWLELKTREMDITPRAREIEGGAGTLTGRIELADLRERVRRLEAIAAGVDL